MPQKVLPLKLPAQLVLAALLWAGSAARIAAKEPVFQTQANVMVELTFTASRAYADPFNEVTLDVVFSPPHGQELRVPAFWAGGNLWRVRYTSSVLGTHRFRTVCSAAQDRGLQGVKGKVQIKPYEGQNPLYVHGPLRLASNWRHLEHADGTPFFWLGDTWWMGLCNRLHWPEEFKRLAADRKKKGFNVIQIVTGLYPDMHPFDPRGANETGFPWTTNYTSIRPEFFNAADDRLLYLVEQGFTPCIFGAWGHYITGMGVENMKKHWRYLIARYGSLPVVWSAAGEANLPWYLVKDFPYDDRKQSRDWSEVMRFIRATDPFHRLLTVHPTGIHRLSSRTVTDDPALLDFDMLQTPHGFRNAVPDTVKYVRQSYEDSPVMPVINGEAAYEMLTVNSGTIPAEWPRRMFWLCMMNGAAGHTYGANGIWQCNRSGQPHGPSPTAGSPASGYGAVPWDEAMNFPGSSQMGLGKKFFEQYRWYDFQPHPEWAEFVTKSSLNFEGSHWIWFPEGDPAKDAPAAKRFFRRTFVLPEGKTIQSAQIRMSADDRFTAWLNGGTLGTGNNFKFGRQFNEFPRLLKPGTNILTVTAENMPVDKANPAGLIARLEIRFADSNVFKLDSDASWLCATNESPGWDGPGFDELSWTNTLVIGRYGDAPWKKVDTLNNDGVFAPQSMGIPGGARIIYVPESDPIRVQKLGGQAAYAASCFDPVTGMKTTLPPVQADDQGACIFRPLAGETHDWVLIIEPKDSLKKSAQQALGPSPAPHRSR